MMLIGDQPLSYLSYRDIAAATVGDPQSEPRKPLVEVVHLPLDRQLNAVHRGRREGTT